jgi:hypothetical protein
MSEIDEKLCGKEFISFALSAMASLFAFFHEGPDLHLHRCGTKEKTEIIGLWSDPWWRSSLTLQDSSAFLRGREAKTRSMVVSLFLSARVIDPWGRNKCRKYELKNEINFSESASAVPPTPPEERSGKGRKFEGSYLTV